MTINEMKKHLELMIEDGYGDHAMRIMVQDSFKHSHYGVNATYSESFTFHNRDAGYTSFYFSLEDKLAHDQPYKDRKQPLISFRK